MSHHDAERLLTDLKTDSALREKLKAGGPEAFEKTAKDAGYHVSREDFADVVKSHVAKIDLAGPKGFQIADGIVSGVGSGVSSVGSGVIGGIV